MPFYLTEEREAAQESARLFAVQECAPLVKKVDEEDYFPRELFERAGELGLIGIGIPESEGGSGFDCTTLCLVSEEISKVMPTLAQIMMSHTGLALHSLEGIEDADLRQQWLPGAAQGKLAGVCCLTESTGNSDMSNWQTTATKEGDEWIINGEKIFCTNVGEADFYIVAAKTDTMDLSRAYGATGFLVPKGAPGVKVGKIEDKIGWRGSSTGSISFENVRVADNHRTSPVNLQFGTWNSGWELIAEGACALGIAEAAYEKAKAFAKQRLMPDGLPYYYRHETMRTRLTEMKMKIEAVRGLTYMYADMFDKGENISPDFMMVKPYSAAVATDVCSVAMDMYGGLGICRDVEIERYWREAKVCMVGGGQYDIQLDSVGLMS